MYLTVNVSEINQSFILDKIYLYESLFAIGIWKQP